MKAFEEMSQTELKNKLEELKDLLEEVMDEKSIILGQQNVHVSSKLISKHAAKYEKEIEEITSNITLVEKLLAS